MALVVPEEKRLSAIQQLRAMLDRKKTTVKELQSLCGFLNFLNKAIVPGRTFTRHMYAKYSQIADFNGKYYRTQEIGFKTDGKGSGLKQLKPHHQVKLDCEFKLDRQVWLMFLTSLDLRNVVIRPMLDVDAKVLSTAISFFSDASKAETLGFGCVLDDKWIFGQWPQGFIKERDPSIEVLELFALTAGILTWEDDPVLNNTRITAFCDNMAVVHMINNMSSRCEICMKMIRMLTLNGLLHNRRLAAKFVKTKDNGVADALSKLQLQRFHKLAPNMRSTPDDIDDRIWPVWKIYHSLN